MEAERGHQVMVAIKPWWGRWLQQRLICKRKREQSGDSKAQRSDTTGRSYFMKLSPRWTGAKNISRERTI